MKVSDLTGAVLVRLRVVDEREGFGVFEDVRVVLRRAERMQSARPATEAARRHAHEKRVRAVPAHRHEPGVRSEPSCLERAGEL